MRQHHAHVVVVCVFQEIERLVQLNNSTEEEIERVGIVGCNLAILVGCNLAVMVGCNLAVMEAVT